MTPSKLQEIARAATLEQDQLNDVCKNCYCTMAIDALDEHTELCHNCAHDWYVTFHPRLIEKLLAAYSAACEMRNLTPHLIPTNCEIITAKMRSVLAFDKAREALDAETKLL